MKNIKCVVIGDGSIGKTCLLVTFTKNEFPLEYIPTVYENYTGNVNVDGETVSLQLWDTAGQEDYKRIRPNFYPNTDVFLVCFSLVSQDTLENVNSIWVPEIKNYCPDAPLVLVGLKSDLRDDPTSHEQEFQENGWAPIDKEKIEEMKNKIGTKYYVECSALKQYNLNKVFESAVRASSEPRTPTSKDQPERRRICLLI